MAGVALAVAGAAPAAAETGIEVETGYAGGYFVAGEAVPVRVTVSSDRLLRGELRIQQDAGNDDPAPVVVPLEVAGGSAKEIVVALPTLRTEHQLRVTASIDGASGRAEARSDEEVELVGLLPGAAEDTPPAVPVPMDLGTARFTRLGEDTLAAPGSLGALGTVAAGPEGLTVLEGAALANVLTWVDEGGRLLVDSAPGAPVEGLPEAWQPTTGRAPAGRGEVRAVGGAIARGAWADVVEPTSVSLPIDRLMQNQFFTEEVLYTLARSSGLERPAVGWMIGFLAVYVVLAGPATYLLVRSRRRGNLAWAAVGAVAVLFTAGAFAGGSDMRSRTQKAHASFVQTGEAGTQAFSYLGLVSPSGTDPRVELPGDWSAGDYTSAFAGLDVGFDGSVDRVASPHSVERRGDSVVTRLDLEAGGYGVFEAWGALPDQPGIEVTAVGAPDGSVGGVVRNATDVQLDAVLVQVANRSWDGGTLAAGEEVEWRLGPDEGEPGDEWGPTETPWREFSGFDRMPDESGPVDYSLWSQRRAADVDKLSTGWVTAAGWTRDWRPPAVSADGPLRGRTVFTTRSPVTAADGAHFPADAVRRQLVRLDFGANDDGTGTDSVLRFTLPANAGPDARLEARLLPMVRGVQSWNGTGWDQVQCPLVGDPGVPDGDSTTCALPTGRLVDGALYLRVRSLDDGTSTWPGISVQAAS